MSNILSSQANTFSPVNDPSSMKLLWIEPEALRKCSKLNLEETEIVILEEFGKYSTPKLLESLDLLNLLNFVHHPRPLTPQVYLISIDPTVHLITLIRLIPLIPPFPLNLLNSLIRLTHPFDPPYDQNNTEKDDIPVTSYPAVRRQSQLNEEHVSPLTHGVYALTW